MTKIAPLFAAGFAVLIAATAADAQRANRQPANDAWCRDMQTELGPIMVCRAYTYEQCMASRTSHGETCYANPLYDPRFKEWRARNPNY
jgi:hypothetical protein